MLVCLASLCFSLSLSPLLAQEANSKDERGYCKPICYNCHCEVDCVYTLAGNRAHPWSYDHGPARGRRGVCESEHAFLKALGERGRALPGVWLVVYPEPTLHPKYGNAGWNAGLVSHTQLRLRAGGGALGPRVYF